MFKEILQVLMQQHGLVKQGLLTGIIILLAVLVANPSWATVPVMRYPTGSSVVVAQTSDIPSATAIGSPISGSSASCDLVTTAGNVLGQQCGTTSQVILGNGTLGTLPTGTVTSSSLANPEVAYATSSTNISGDSAVTLDTTNHGIVLDYLKVNGGASTSQFGATNGFSWDPANAPYSSAKLTLGSTGSLTLANASAHAGQATCWTTSGVIGYCTSVVGVGGGCTCTGL